MLKYVPDHHKNQVMCEMAAEKYQNNLEYVLNNLKTQEMCGKAVCIKPYTLRYIPDWFVTQRKIKLWCDHDYFSKWYDCYDRYKKRNKKASIKEELSPIAWHPSRYWDWCMSEDEKKETEKLWA